MQPQYNPIFQSIIEVFHQIRSEGIPPNIIQAALNENDWFTEYYINAAFEGILDWHTQQSLTRFLLAYPNFQWPELPLKVAIIGAGNIPFVAWHDLLMTILSGNTATVKLSRQDKVLIPYIVQKWAEILPAIHSRIQFTEKIKDANFLIATGSDNTARQLAYHYKNTPKIIRKHRFSAGIWQGDEKQLPQFCKDILLYNGLGCRSTSVLFIPDLKDLPTLESAFRDYPQSLFSNNYIKKKKYEKARLQMLNIPFKDAESILLLPTDLPTPQGMGVLTVAPIDAYEKFYARFSQQLQCISGKTCLPGEAQNPGISDFADGLDTFQRLIDLNTSHLSGHSA